jgi:tetratricopeptide (TPR) repeat protein
MFLFSFSYSLEISVNYAKYQGEDYSTLNIKNDETFSCIEKDKKYICTFDKLPDTPVFETHTIFFYIKPLFDKDTFILEITPKTKSFIKSFEKNLYDNYDKSLKHLKKAKKWVIISYKNKPPFLTNKKIDGLQFPLEVSEQEFFIGAIDVDGNPIEEDSKSADVDEYFKIVKKFKKNGDVMEDIDMFIKSFPNSLFTPDVILMKLKLLDQENNHDELLKFSKIWIKNFSFNENLPEVLLLTAKTYSAMGFMSDAVYFYERLFTEYPQNKFTYEAMVYLADQLYTSGDEKKAFEFYNRALMFTKNIEVASLAASRLGQRYMEKGQAEKSASYYNKVYDSNKLYILRDKEYAYNLAKELGNHLQYNLALKILTDLFKDVKKTDDEYESMIYHLALWNYEDKNFKTSVEYIDRYLKEFEDLGEFSAQIESLRDKVVFEVDDKNTTAMMNKYNNIIKNYSGDKIANRAFYKKIKLLEKLKKYDEILSLKDEIEKLPNSIFKEKDKKDFIYNTAKNLVQNNLKKDCFKAIKVYGDYNISLDKKYDDDIYNCSYKTREFNIASRICNKYLNSFDKKIALKWSINKEKVLKKLRNYQGVVNIVDDICTLDKNCDDYKYDKFDALWNLEKYESSIALSKELEKNKKIKNIDIFYKIISYAKSINNDLLVYDYAKKIVDYQNRYKTSTYTPSIDFLLVQKAKVLNKKDVAKNTLINLSKKKISDENKARVFYDLGNITNDKKYLQKCLEINGSKTWRPLCKDALSF